MASHHGGRLKRFRFRRTACSISVDRVVALAVEALDRVQQAVLIRGGTE
jgi:hypothetical protein